MILHPGVLALLVGGLASLLMVMASALFGLTIVRRWNPALADERQLSLERRSCLVATLVQWAVVFEILSLPLFVYTADALHPLFVGAMCATGTLNANPLGWSVLFTKLALFFIGSLWLVVNHYDQRSPLMPLVRVKFIGLLGLLPVIALDTLLTILYFNGLQPEVITSCCGALFSSGGSGVASELASLPLWPMILTYYLVAAGYLVLLLTALRLTGALCRVLLAMAAMVFGGVAIASVVSFIAVYFYQLPSHHCPFDLLQGHYHYIGFPLYLFLFGSVLCGLVPLLLTLLRKWAGLSDLPPSAVRIWLIWGIISLLCMVGLVSWPLLFSDFTLQAYF